MEDDCHVSSAGYWCWQFWAAKLVWWFSRAFVKHLGVDRHQRIIWHCQFLQFTILPEQSRSCTPQTVPAQSRRKWVQDLYHQGFQSQSAIFKVRLSNGIKKIKKSEKGRLKTFILQHHLIREDVVWVVERVVRRSHLFLLQSWGSIIFLNFSYYNLHPRLDAN